VTPTVIGANMTNSEPTNEIIKFIEINNSQTKTLNITIFDPFHGGITLLDDTGHFVSSGSSTYATKFPVSKSKIMKLDIKVPQNTTTGIYKGYINFQDTTNRIFSYKVPIILQVLDKNNIDKYLKFNNTLSPNPKSIVVNLSRLGPSNHTMETIDIRNVVNKTIHSYFNVSNSINNSVKVTFNNSSSDASVILNPMEHTYVLMEIDATKNTKVGNYKGTINILDSYRRNETYKNNITEMIYQIPLKVLVAQNSTE